MTFIPEDREQLLQSLRGRKLRIPDLQAMLKHWPQYVHPELDCLRKDVNRHFRECVSFQQCQLEAI